MNIQDEKIKLKIKYENTLKVLEQCKGFEDDVWFYNETTIFFKAKNYEQCLKILHNFKNYGLIGYYINGNNLAMRYEIADKPEIILLCNTPKHALEKISGGKCKIEETQIVQKKVVCEC